MRSALRISVVSIFSGALFAQYPGLTLPPSGNNQKSSVTQFIGPVRVSIEYSSPNVHGTDGKDRRGQIWGKLVPYGLANLGFGNGKPDPWRAGANENTVFTISHEAIIEGSPLPAGRYGLFMIPEKDEWTIVFSKDSGAWGSFFYEPSHDALRVKVKPHSHEYREWLAYEFPVRKQSEAVAELQWEELAVPFSIKIDHMDDIYVDALRREITNVPGFAPQGLDAAAQYCLQANTHLDQALEWAEAAVNNPFVGQVDFTTLSTKAQVLSKMGRDAEAKKVMEVALKHPTAGPLQIHQYGRQLMAAKKNAEAMEVFKYNAEKNGDVWPVHVGLARSYSMTGDLPKALENAKIALKQAPDELNRKSLEGMIDVLSKGKPIDQ
jgi:hypothetical protein